VSVDLKSGQVRSGDLQLERHTSALLLGFHQRRVLLILLGLLGVGLILVILLPLRALCMFGMLVCGEKQGSNLARDIFKCLKLKMLKGISPRCPRMLRPWAKVLNQEIQED